MKLIDTLDSFLEEDSEPEGSRSKNILACLHFAQERILSIGTRWCGEIYGCT